MLLVKYMCFSFCFFFWSVSSGFDPLTVRQTRIQRKLGYLLDLDFSDFQSGEVPTVTINMLLINKRKEAGHSLVVKSIEFDKECLEFLDHKLPCRRLRVQKDKAGETKERRRGTGRGVRGINTRMKWKADGKRDG